MNLKYSDIAVIIPAYNEEKNIRTIIQSTLQFAHHIIVIDDGSTDNTVMQIIDLPITLLKNTKNEGKGASLLRGFREVLSRPLQGVITIDADAQHNPQDIPQFITAMQKHPNQMIIGARIHNKENAPKARYHANRVADFFISWAAGQRITDTQSGYRFYPMQFLRQGLSTFRYRNFTFESEILINGTRQGYAPQTIAIQSHYPKNSRASHYRPLIDTFSIIGMVSWKIISRGFYLRGLYRSMLK